MSKTSFKNEILSNLIQKFSEEAKMQYELSVWDNKQFTNNENDIPMKTQDNNGTNGTFTQDLFKMQYPDYHPETFVKPMEFNPKKKEKEVSENNGNSGLNLIQKWIKKTNTHAHLVSLLRNLNWFSWWKAYQDITGETPKTVDNAIMNIKKNYYFGSKIGTLCEVKEIIVIDCLQVITVKDISLQVKKIILTKGNNQGDIVDNIIDDYFLKIGEVFLCNFNEKKEEEKDYYRVKVEEIQKCK